MYKNKTGWIAAAHYFVVPGLQEWEFLHFLFLITLGFFFFFWIDLAGHSILHQITVDAPLEYPTYGSNAYISRIFKHQE